MEQQQEKHSGIKLGLVLTYLLLLMFLTIAGGSDSPAFNLNNPSTILLMKLLQAVGVILIFILPSLLLAGLWTREKLRYIGMHRRPSLMVMLIAGIGMLTAVPLINWLAEINQQMHLPEALSGVEEWMRSSEDKATALTEAFLRGDTIGVLLVNLFVIALMAALSEEIFFRGILQRLLIENRINAHVAVWAGAILFSAFHMQFFGFIPRMLMGAFLGYLFLWSGSLWPGILAHFLNNGMAVYLVWLANRGAISPDADKVGSQGQEWLFVLLSALLVVMSLLMIYMKRKKESTADDSASL